ncbi:hypothetical protein B0T17DRAFT_587275 [Bombardia bombarda]|uniref:Uncharacterized protein n=1 Tax=Bombardia bombarda TaxID=252184 RepID=A0AA39XL03_9PEZI|nr:hypothetical protein B0T17DRAFT_587275 [Bombardia bombarda]
MAATPFDTSSPPSSFVFDIFNDGQAIRNAPALPGGPCNYTDQTLPRCGCRRFWSRLSLGNGLQSNTNLAEICMCSHHACFHEDVLSGQSQQPPLLLGNVMGQENQKPRTNREPLSPVQDLASFHMPSSIVGSSLDFNVLNFQSSIPNHHQEAANPLNIEDPHLRPESPMPDTLNSWEHLIQSQPGGHSSSLPPIPPQCLMPSSQPPSTACSSQARYLRPFAGKGLHTLSGGSALRNEASDAEQEAGNGSQGAIALHKPAREGHASADDVSRTTRDVTPRPGQFRDSSSRGTKGDTLETLSSAVKGFEQRIDRLENTSFSVAGHEDCHDKHEHTDLRVTELESRVEEVEKILNDNSSIGSSRRTVRPDGADDATASVISVATNSTALASNRVEMYSQIQALQAQVSQLQAASLPSYTKPWELEVVFLPFSLKGLWMEARDFPSQRQSTGTTGEEWTQMPNTVSRATPDPQSPKFAEWAGQSHESNWLLPRAFASGRVIDQRLKSRGLIKNVLVRGPDARSIQLAVHNAFGDIFRISSSPSARSGYPPSSPLAEFLGLRQSWVPLRKIHKDSRLRFLAPAEMTTPALWDFTFLVSSVVMKATGIHRLYVTQPEAYLQDQPVAYHAYEAGWTWQKLRELTRVYPDSQSSSGDIPEADAMEECWGWNDRLDDPPSVNTSALSLRQVHQQQPFRRSSSSLSQQFYTGIESPSLSNNHAMIRAPSPLIQRERRSSRSPFIRNASLPPVAPITASPSQSRRRLASHNLTITPYERRSSPFVPRPSPRYQTHAAAITPITTSSAFTKRRLNTRSPSVNPRNTPHWSRATMSRSPSLAPYGGQQPHQERRTTPFYYATPHSDAIPEPHGYNRAGSRGPIILPPTNGYDPDDDEDMDDDFGDDGGSSTDPYDSQMTNDVHDNAAGSRPSGAQHNASYGLDTDPDDADFDIDVYEDGEEDELDGIDTDAGNDVGSAWHGFGQGQPVNYDSQNPRPEDIPWAGIEDHMSDGENVDPESQELSQSQGIAIHEDADALNDGDIDITDRGEEGGDDDEVRSAVSSQPPSEYSSKPSAWPLGAALAANRVEGQQQQVVPRNDGGIEACGQSAGEAESELMYVFTWGG